MSHQLCTYFLIWFWLYCVAGKRYWPAENDNRYCVQGCTHSLIMTTLWRIITGRAVPHSAVMGNLMQERHHSLAPHVVSQSALPSPPLPWLRLASEGLLSGWPYTLSWLSLLWRLLPVYRTQIRKRKQKHTYQCDVTTYQDILYVHCIIP